jgi:hypothetical protein
VATIEILHANAVELSLVPRSRIPRKDDDVPKQLEHTSRPIASTYAGHLSMLRVFFRDLQEWEMIPRRFDPIRSFITPKSVLAKIGPNPRIISDDVWAKLVWAGLNLTADDIPKHRNSHESSYPVEMCKALVITWLFAGLRNNEIVRLRPGCIRWQKDEATVPGDSEMLPGGLGLHARRSSQQDFHRLHEAGRSDRWGKHIRMGGGPTKGDEIARPEDRRTG